MQVLEFKSGLIKCLFSLNRCRHLDLGDVSASNTVHFVNALNSDVQGIQVDFDDGHCPTWKNQLQAYQNVNLAVLGKLNGAPVTINTCPVLMLRPRAWNMIEHNILVNDLLQLLYKLNKNRNIKAPLHYST